LRDSAGFAPDFAGPRGARRRRRARRVYDRLRRHLAELEVLDAADGKGLAAGLEEMPAAFQDAAADIFCGYASFYRTEVALAGAEAAECRRFVVDSGFMALPGGQPPGVEAAPPYLRGALAFHHAPGPFDPVPPSSFRYYLTPPLPEWDRVAKALWSEILGEGWAHYCEAAFDAGSATATPRPRSPCAPTPWSGRPGCCARSACTPRA
jgi:hypothetical protein